jgi:hypothetical protein
VCLWLLVLVVVFANLLSQLKLDSDDSLRTGNVRPKCKSTSFRGPSTSTLVAFVPENAHLVN